MKPEIQIYFPHFLTRSESRLHLRHLKRGDLPQKVTTMFRNIFRNLIACPASDSWIRTLARKCGVWMPWDSRFVETSRYTYSKAAGNRERVYLTKSSAGVAGSTDYKAFIHVPCRGAGSAFVTISAPGGSPVAKFLLSADALKSLADGAASAAAYAAPRTGRRMDAVEWQTVEAEASA